MRVVSGSGWTYLHGFWYRAEEFDCHQLSSIQSTEESGIRHNHHNTPAKRMLANATRNASQVAKSLATSEAQKSKKSKRAGKGKVQSHPYDAAVDEDHNELGRRPSRHS